MTQQLTPQQYAERNALGFEGDNFIFEELKTLVDKFKINHIVETGTYLGFTSVRLSELAPVDTFEVSNEYYLQARLNIDVHNKHNPINPWYSDSAQGIDSLLKTIKEKKLHKPLFFLDAHWGDVCPLKAELMAIAKHKLKPVIAIHDWKVPNEPTLGFDSYKGQAFTYEWIKPELDNIYGIDGYDYHYNSDKLSSGAKRGVIYVYPKVKTKRPRISKK